MCVVYKYIDKFDNIVKYVGIVYSDNKTLKDRVREHKQEDWCKNGLWEIQYFVVNSRAEAEAYESHFIYFYGTGKYYNKAKINHGLISFLPDVTWIDYESILENEELRQRIKSLESQLRKIINDNKSLQKQIDGYEHELMLANSGINNMSRKQYRSFLKQRQLEGMNAMPIDATTGKRKSLKTGRVVGRPCVDFPKEWESVYSRWKSKEIKAVEAMQILNLKKNSFYTLVKRYERQQNEY